MLDINKIIQNHRSIRSYLHKEISDDLLTQIILSIQAVPTWNNAQDYSIIVIKDPLRKKSIAEISGRNPQLETAPVVMIFMADFFKTNIAAIKNNMEQKVQNSVNGIVTATFNAGIGMGAAIIAAEASGLGVSVVGGIRNNIDKLCEILDLPDYTFPLAAICLGYPNVNPPKKPRMPMHAFAHEETYKKNIIEGYINEYDEIMANYLKSVGRADTEISWSHNTSKTYSREDNGLFGKTLQSKKFNFNK